MSDDLLDEATRLAGDYADHHHDYGMARVLNELIERVRDAENEADTQVGIAAIRTAERDSLRFELDGARMVARKNNEYLIAERDEARAKLDKVRDLAHRPFEFVRVNGSGEPVIRTRDVLAILDGKEADV